MTECMLGGLAGLGVRVIPVTSRSSMTWPHVLGEGVQLPLRTDRTLPRVLVDGLHRVWPQATRMDADVWLYPKGFLPWLNTGGLPAVAVVHDAIVAHYATHYPAYMGRATTAYLERALTHALRHATTVVTVSEHARQELNRFAERSRLRVRDIRVGYAASDYETLLGTEPSHVAKRDCVVHLAATAPHKQTLGLLEHWQVLEDRGMDLPELLLVGSIARDARRLADRLRTVRVLDSLPERQFRRTLAEARALVMASEVEGFGLPILEGYYLGTPGLYPAETAMDEYMAPVSSHGRFERGDVDDFAHALERTLGRSSQEVFQDACSLRRRYSRAQLAERLREALVAAS
ncbi:MAG: glycosyltransferase [Myxococcales bacterium]|nr:glycosyltransferase [Myxococcales bacterium]MDD9970753.1 glycosyltransferase [Myxococcales bacterium]